jgi:hypothetical protein
MKIVAGEKMPAFSGENLDARITLFNDKLVSKINDDRWREVLSQCIPEGMDDIQSGDKHGDVSMLDHIAGNILDFKSPGKHK